MKKTVWLLSILCILNLSVMKAQTGKGNILVGVSSSLNLTGSGSDLMSFGYSSSKVKSDASGFQDSEPTKSTSFNFMPKIGYFVIDNLAVGLDMGVGLSHEENNSSSYNYTSNTNLVTVGPFVRYYFPSGKILPFAEVGGFLGSAKEKYEMDSENQETKLKVGGFGAGLGIAAPLGEKVTFDVMLAYNTYTVKDKDNNSDNERTVTNTLGLKLGFIVFLGGK